MNRSPIAIALAAGLFTLVLADLAGGQAGVSDRPAGGTVVMTPSLTLEGANRVLASAIAKAKERNAGGAIAVVDQGGSLVAFQRLDGTFPAGAAVSLGKARTAATFKKPTKAFEDAINGGRTALAAVHELTPLQGGVPIVVDGQVIGAVGVSGAHSQQEDEEIAFAGASAIGVAPSKEAVKEPAK